MKYSKLRIAWAVVCGIVCVLLIALWVRSYWWWDSVVIPIAGSRVVCGQSVIGRTMGSVRILAEIDCGVGGLQYIR
jgi:hypothetical protein